MPPFELNHPFTPRGVCRAPPLLLPYECRTAAIEENDRNRQAHTSQLIFGRFCSRKRLDGKKKKTSEGGPTHNAGQLGAWMTLQFTHAMIRRTA